MPFDYYRLPFCKPPEGIKKATGTINPGTVLLGIRIYNSPYNFSIMEKTEGQYVCKGEAYPDHAYPPLSDREEKRLKDRIFQQYRVRLILDNLPITTYDLELDNESVLPGYELGYHKGSKFYVNNHLMFKARGQPFVWAGNKARKARKLQQAAAGLVPGEKLYMIVGFEASVPLSVQRSLVCLVIACSVKREAGKPLRSVPCTQSPDDPNAPPAQLVAKGEKITYTYDVYWGTSDITWASRWDAYLRMPGGKVHWFSILNSLMVVVVMSCIVAMIMMRTIRRDLQRYEQLLVGGPWGRVWSGLDLQLGTLRHAPWGRAGGGGGRR
eukprot:scaffold1.g5291.t1